MPQTIRTLIQICLFKAKPQDLDTSVNLLVMTVVATLGLFMVRNNYFMASKDILAISLTQVGLLGLGLRILLALFSKSSRWLQSATALYGCSALILFAVILFVLLFNTSLASGNLLLIQLAIIASGLWYFAILVFIIRETLEIGVVLAFFMALAVELFFAIILLILFGEQML